MDNVSSDMYRSIKGKQNMIFTKKEISTNVYIFACLQPIHLSRWFKLFQLNTVMYFLSPTTCRSF